MDILADVTNVHVSKEEAIRDLTMTQADIGLRMYLFEECRAEALAHLNDVMVNRRGSALCPMNRGRVRDCGWHR